MSDKTAIVVGATGVVGRALVDQLVLAPHIRRVIALTRRPVPSESDKIENEVVDFENLEQYQSLFHGDYLFSAMGTTLKQAGSKSAQRRIDVDYQYDAARLAAENGVHHYLLVSSSFANPHSRNFYTRIKGELEEAVLELPFQRVSIFQPFIILGQRRDSRPLEQFAAALFRGLSQIPGLRAMRPMHGHEIASKMLRVSQSPGPEREWIRPSDFVQA